MKSKPEVVRAQILVVDDDPAAATATSSILLEFGHAVTVAHGWTDALRAFDPSSTDLVLMDAVMPNVDGLKLTRLLREQSASYVPMVFLTGLTSKEVREQCINAGADDFLTKPVDPLELRVRLKAMLRIRALTKALEDKSREFERAARTDSLTGVGNRRVFDERIMVELSRATRHQRPLSLLMFDLDHFKAVNDRFGHMAGDQLLALFGQVLRDQLRVTDIPCRYGGEEFMIIAPETTADQAKVLAERVRRVFARSAAELKTGPQTVSVGIAGTDMIEGRPDREVLVLTADAALYRAKGRGRDRVEVGGSWPADG
ncbi:GGDEF domain-containing response regulator [Enhygromyxa salina]|uniref:GGDEF domain-containing response regulator n=1 Tax=Enhygromyxa salina TaxID=215803 RepID=UPI0004E6BCC6|nr:diguanylate cyclase [Enhygromyxa salina]